MPPQLLKPVPFLSFAPLENAVHRLKTAGREAVEQRSFDTIDAQIRAAHAEGYAAVGGSLDLRRRPKELEPYAAGGGRNPAFTHPLVCPSLLPPLEPNDEVAGLPAWRPEGDEPWVYDARIRLLPRLRSRKPL